ncbi:MAG: phenylalanine--tRNA ligase subunit alpha, partial [Pirellulaceae bacterium]
MPTMPLTDFVSQLDTLAAEATNAFAGAADAAALEAARIEYLGAKSGRLKEAQKGLGAVSKEDKPAAGKRFNEVKTQIEGAFEAAQSRLAGGPAKKTSGPQFDPTVPGTPLRMGHLHPITQTIEELKDIMGRLGFSVAEGPEVEDEWHNFEALNIPADHPARDPQENFFLSTPATAVRSPQSTVDSQIDSGLGTVDSGLLLRSQTSTVQIRVMEKTKPPVRVISIGRVYRPDEADKTHYPMFHQIEGLLVDRGITMAHLKSVLRMFATSY